MAYDKDAMIDALSGLTVLDLLDLVESLKSKWGVQASAAMPMMMPGAAAAAEPAAPVEEQTEFTVIIKTAGDKKLNVIKEVRTLTGLGLKEAKDLVEQGGAVKENVSKQEAQDIRKKLEEVGATIEVK